MDNLSKARFENKKMTKAILLTIIMVIMDLSALSGVFAGELDDSQDKRETHSGLNAPGFMQGLANQSTTFSLSEGNHGGCAVLDNGELACWGDANFWRVYSNGGGSYTPVIRSGFPSGVQVE